MGPGLAIALIIIGVVVLFFVVWAIGKRNAFITMVNNVDEGFATIDVYLKKRYDLIPNLLETVKGYMKHEKGTFESVVKARALAMNAAPDQKAEAENNLTGTLKTLFALAENYPELKANTQFSELQDELKAIETELSQARRYYNGVVKNYNTRIQIFPDNIVANMMKLQKRPYFELDSEAERKNVKISFD